MLLAGIRKKSLDARLRGHDGWVSDTYCVELYLGEGKLLSGPSQLAPIAGCSAVALDSLVIVVT
jgi:hypothetical protein